MASLLGAGENEKAMISNPKSENRNPKEIRNSKSEWVAHLKVLMKRRMANSHLERPWRSASFKAARLDSPRIRMR